jgi:hypothetical protein
MAVIRIALVAGLIALGGAAYPQSEAARTEADRHFERALRFYNVQSYEEAIGELKAAYQIDPRPELLYVLGQAQRLNHQCAPAIASYEAFLRTAPSPRQESAARDQIDACRAELASTPAASGGAAGSGSPPPIAAPAVSAATVAVAPPVVATGPSQAPPAPAPAAPIYRRWWFWAAIGSGVATGFLIAASAGAFTRARDAGCPAGRDCIP